MKKEFTPNSVKFIYTKNELAYQEVLDDFQNASEITIVTYDISTKREELIDALKKKTKKSCVINVITNIPNRWEKYYGYNKENVERNRTRAKRTINLYLSKLKPESLGKIASVYFDFSNHGKIIMTDNIVYIGSANYSEESAKNVEFGFISQDKSLIDYINSFILPDIRSTAVPYYEYDYTSLLLEANMLLAAIHAAKNELYEETHRFYDDIEGHGYYYASTEATLSVETLDKIVQLTKESCRIARDIYNAVAVVTLGNDEELDSVSDIYEELRSICAKIEKTRCCDTLINLSEFDSEDYINQQLQDKYAMEAYEENLENCIEDASEDMREVVSDLSSAAQADIETLLAQIQEQCNIYSAIIEKLRVKELKKVNSTIDNT